MNAFRCLGRVTVLIAGLTTRDPLGAQQPANAVLNTRAARRDANATSCAVEFAIARSGTPQTVGVMAPSDTSRPAGAATSTLAANDSTAVQCLASSSGFVSRVFRAALLTPIQTIPAAPPPPTSQAFIPGRITISSSAGEVALPLKPVPDSGIIKRKPPIR
jgi:hypothetical protein